MPAIWTSRQPWARRPSGLVTLNRGSGLARGLREWYVCGPSDRWTIHGTARYTPEGAYVDADSSGFVRTYAYETWWATATQITYHVIMHWPSSVTGLTRDVIRHDGCATLQYHSATNALRGVYWPTSGTGGIAHIGTTATAALAGRRHLALTMVVDQAVSTYPSIYVDGMAASMTTSGSVSTRAATYRVALGCRPPAEGGGEGMTGGTFLTAAAWDRALSPAEIRALYDPRTRWELYQPIVKRSYFDMAGGAPPANVEGTGSLTAGSATLSATGTLRVTATASVTATAATLSATGAQRHTATSALTVQAATTAATATQRNRATSTLTAGAATVTASGSVGSAITGTATLSATAATLAAVATQTHYATATLTASAATIWASQSAVLAADADTWRARSRPTAWRARSRPTAWKAKP